jgi:hypothetical protein
MNDEADRIWKKTTAALFQNISMSGEIARSFHNAVDKVVYNTKLGSTNRNFDTGCHFGKNVSKR